MIFEIEKLSDKEVAEYSPLVQQVPSELKFFLDFLISRDVKTILTMGCLQGGLEFNIAKRYTEEDKQCSIVGLDWMLHKEMLITAQVVRRRFPKISLTFIRYDTQRKNNVCELGIYDFVFVDADHSYKGCKSDKELALKHTTKYIGFHDLKDTDYYKRCNIDCGVQQVWREIKAESKYQIHESIDPSCEWGGIGILDMT